MAVTAHFLDRQGCHQMRLCHSGENLACTLLEVVREWGLEDRVGVVVSDNAATNDACLQNFYQNLDSSMKSTAVRARRMRCYGHVLNLVARAFLYGEDFEAFEAESQVLDLLSRQEEELRHWRKKGPVGKLHNIVKFIGSSPQRSELFKRVARENDETQGFRLAFVRTGHYRRQIPPAPFAMPTVVVIAVITAVTVAAAVAVDIIGDVTVDGVRGETVLTSTFIWLGLLRRLGRAATFPASVHSVVEWGCLATRQKHDD